jgi:hypothetical protein
MRISTAAIVIALAAGGALAWPITQAFAVQDQPVITIGGVESVCTGVGSAKDNPAWAGYPVKLVFATPSGNDLAAVHVALTQGGKTVMETDCDAPWLLVKAPAGSYGVNASVPGQTGGRNAVGKFSTSGSGAQKTVTLTFPRSTASAQ